MSQTQVLSASTVMDQAAALMNDAAKSIYPYTIQIPYLNMALQELQEFFELNNIPVTDTATSTPIDVSAGVSYIEVPDDLIEPKVVWERQSGVDPYTSMTRLDFLPRSDEGVEISQFLYFVWSNQQIHFLPANQDNQIKINYIKALFAPITASSDGINIINAASFLEYRTAGLLAEFCAENPSRASSLNADAILGMDRAIGIGTKGRQVIMTRHRPFRSGYKRRTYG